MKGQGSQRIVSPWARRVGQRVREDLPKELTLAQPCWISRTLRKTDVAAEKAKMWMQKGKRGLGSHE